ncbi:MAG: DinB family protein [Anaerolineales bacterium]|nr:DinB family protein [Anaerolineales bacterium]
MSVDWRRSTWKQFGAAIDMLADAIHLCPEHLWTVEVYKDSEDERFGQFWFVSYHTLKWLDQFLEGVTKGFKPPAPFIVGALPEQPYTKNQVVEYLGACRKKCQTTIESLTDERAGQILVFDWMEPSFLELQLYCMRHVQEHAAQLSLILGQHGVTGTDWVASARSENI